MTNLSTVLVFYTFQLYTICRKLIQVELIWVGMHLLQEINEKAKITLAYPGDGLNFENWGVFYLL